MSEQAKVEAPTPNMWARNTYRTGDGEVQGAVRPGSQDMQALPSRFGNVLKYRDGRQETLE